MSSNKCKRFTIHHRRHFTSCLPRRNLLYVRRFHRASLLQEAPGAVGRRPLYIQMIPYIQALRRTISTLQEASGAVGRRPLYIPMLLYLQDSWAFVRFAFRSNSTGRFYLQEASGAVGRRPLYIQMLLYLQDSLGRISRTRANSFHSTGSIGGMRP